MLPHHLADMSCKVGTPRTPLPHIRVSLNMLDASALLDSGSARSLVSAQFYQRLVKSHCVKKVKETKMVCYTATNEPMDITVLARIHFKIDRFSWTFDFLVAPSLHMDLILGIDFMRASGMILNFQKESVQFNFDSKVSIPIAGWSFSSLRNPQFILESESPPDDYVHTINLAHLSPERKQAALNILTKYPEVLTKKLGRTSLLEYEISLNDKTPVRGKPYALSPPKMEALRNHVDKLLNDDVVRPSKSQYASPAFLVPKGEHDSRMVIDYRKLNQKIDVEAVPLPDINTAFSWFGKAKWFCVLDMNSAYFQIPLAEKSKHISAFCVPWGLYEFQRVAFGLATGAQVLTRLANLLFQDLRFRNLVNFLDDFVLYAETFEELMVVLDEVLRRFKEAGITINPLKLHVAVKEITYLGHKISGRGIEIDPERTRALREFEPPKDAKGVARFIGMVNFWGKFIPKFAERAAPLNALRRKGVKFEWTPVQQTAFLDLKKCISESPILQKPDFDKEFILQTDGSSQAVGAVLLQEHDGVRLPIAYGSRVLTDQEKKYCIYEIECLGVLFGVEKFRVYLEHNKEFLLECDNQALSWLLGHPKQLGRIARWVLRISSFKFRVNHIKGSENVLADALSRMFNTETPSNEQPSISVNAVKVNMPVFPVAHENILEHQLEDPEMYQKITLLQQGTLVPRHLLSKGVLCCRESRTNAPKIALPTSLRSLIFKYYHNSVFGGHLGNFKTLNKIREFFIYPGMKEDVCRRIKNCEICALSKPAQQTHWGKMASQVTTKPMEKFYVDYVGQLVRSKSGFAFILVVMDAFTRFIWLQPVRQATARNSIQELKKIFQCNSFPKLVVTDNAKCFDCEEFKSYLASVGIQRIPTSPFYPAANAVERVNRNLKNALIAYHSKNQTSWDENLNWIQLSLNLARHEAHGRTPFELMYNFKPNHPLSLQWSIEELLPDDPTDAVAIWKQAKQKVLENHHRSRERYNQDRYDHPFKVNDLVLVRAHYQSNRAKKFMSKLAFRWIGPFKITNFSTPVTAVLVDPQSSKFIKISHVSHLKMFSAASRLT